MIDLRQRRALWAVLALTLGATGWLALQDEASPPVAAAAVTRGPQAARAAPSRPARLAWPLPPKPDRESWPAAEARALAAWGDVSSRAQAAPVVVAPAADAAADDAPASAPPFPYQWVGRLQDGVVRAVLNGPQRSLLVQAGDVIDGQWRVRAATATGIELEHLPTRQIQHLP